MKNPGIQISGIGTVNCTGIGAQNLWESTISERSGLQDGIGVISNSVAEKLQFQFPSAAEASKAVLLAYAAIQEAMENAGWPSLDENDGIILATTTGQIPVWESDATRFLKNEISAAELSRTLRKQTLGSLTSDLSSLLGFNGRSLLVSSACSAATQAIGLASLWIAQGKVKRCLVGGVEVLCNLTLEGFRSLQLLSNQNATPFALNRKGINLSEGAAFLCLEASSAHSPKALAYVNGFGWSADAHHMTAPHPEGKGSFEAMQAALKSANLSANEISWVHAHGTGSPHNDMAESLAIGRLFENGDSPYVASTKWIHGHALGASGALETVLCVKALANQMILKTSGLTDPDPKIKLRHPQSHQRMTIRHILKNTLGFGGSNASLILGSEMPRYA